VHFYLPSIPQITADQKKIQEQILEIHGWKSITFLYELF
jgi:hypothetical protein